jgi:hypothetical protein
LTSRAYTSRGFFARRPTLLAETASSSARRPWRSGGDARQFVFGSAEQGFAVPGVADRHGEVLVPRVEGDGDEAVTAERLADGVLGDDVGAGVEQAPQGVLVGEARPRRWSGGGSRR